MEPLRVSTAEQNPAMWRRKTRPVAVCQAPWRARSQSNYPPPSVHVLLLRLAHCIICVPYPLRPWAPLQSYRSIRSLAGKGERFFHLKPPLEPVQQSASFSHKNWTAPPASATSSPALQCLGVVDAAASVSGIRLFEQNVGNWPSSRSL